ncbi:MAG: hypothetical protein KDC56_00720 [Flavobacteriaceae bacterium]|nr:hypothetical protein [Flavobacteriaceae bacterium]
MKKTTFILFLFVALATQQISAQSAFDKWEALKSFHSVMSQTYHPMEEGNLEPVKSRSGELMEQANTLATSKIPAEFNTDSMKASVKKLKKDSKSLHKLVKSKKSTDEEIKKSLENLQDAFHQIVGLCRGDDH